MTYQPTRALSQVEVEERILRVVDTLEERTTEFQTLSENAAEAEAEYKKTRAHSLIALTTTSIKMTAGEREARADLASADSHQAYLLRKAARDSCRESLSSLRDQLNALRTLAANIRGQS